MRSADAITLFRTLLVFPIAWAILTRFNPAVTILAIGVMFVLDAVDGYAAIRDASKGGVSLADYMKYALGDKKIGAAINKLRPLLKKQSVYGARIDIAGDRATEYVLWIVFAYVNIVPLWVLFIIILRHSFVDAFMGMKGTSSRMKSGFARRVYSSKFGRFGVGALKAVTFSYLTLVFVSGYPISIGYALIVALVGYILLRGLAELCDCLEAEK